MITRYYVRQLKDGVKSIGCYDVEHTTVEYSGLNAALQTVADRGYHVIEFLGAIVLSGGGVCDPQC